MLQITKREQKKSGNKRIKPHHSRAMETESEKTTAYSHEVRITGKDGKPKTTKVPVVQELVRQGLRQLPNCFNTATLPCSVLSSSSSSPPVIDMNRLKSGSEPNIRAEELRNLARAAEDWGLFFVTGHGVSPDLMGSLKDAIKGFFDLTFEEKKESVGSYFSTDNLGYGRSFVQSEDQLLDWTDRYAVRVQPSQDELGLNLWPQNPPNFRSVLETYSLTVRDTCDQILEGMAESFGLQRRRFVDQFRPTTNSLVNVRVNYYPPFPGIERPNGISPHSDGSVVTVIAQFDGVEGLEVLRREGWVRVPAPEDALLVGAGDLMEVMSNGRVKSPWHRAATRRDVERYSVALFYYPPEDGEVVPVKGGDAGEVEFYRKVVVGDYLKNYYKVSPTKEKTAINFARI